MTEHPPSPPKHKEIGESLRTLVASIAPGEALPPERQLAERWGVARMTVRQAIAALAREGLVTTVHGRGNLRAPDPINVQVRLRSFATAVRESGLTPTTVVLEHGIDEAPRAEVSAFIGVGRRVLRVRRLRLGNGVPLALEDTWLLASAVGEIDEKGLSGSLYAHLAARGKVPDTGEEVIGTAMPSDEEVRLLQTAPTRPVLRLTRRASLGREPVEYAEAVFPGDRCQVLFPLRSD